MYLELGRKRYCTIKLPKKNKKNNFDSNMSGSNKKNEYYNNDPGN